MKKREEERLRRRENEQADAWHFLTHTEEEHATKCLFALRDEPRCSRFYDPGPLDEQFEKMYEGTPLGALWGLQGSDRFAADLAGWTVIGQGDVRV